MLTVEASNETLLHCTISFRKITTKKLLNKVVTKNFEFLFAKYLNVNTSRFSEEPNSFLEEWQKRFLIV